MQHELRKYKLRNVAGEVQVIQWWIAFESGVIFNGDAGGDIISAKRHLHAKEHRSEVTALENTGVRTRSVFFCHQKYTTDTKRERGQNSFWSPQLTHISHDTII